MSDDQAIAKLDFNNAFSCLHQDIMLEAVLKHVQEIYAFCHLFYSTSIISKVKYRAIVSNEGMHQRDLFGPLFFCLTIHPLLQSLFSKLIIGYKDDITLGGPIDIVATDVSSLKNKDFSFGVHLNTGKYKNIA